MSVNNSSSQAVSNLSSNLSSNTRMTTPSLANARYYPQLAMVFIALLLTANVVGEKPLQFFGSIVLPAGLMLFPLTYLIGDLLTEVYGFKASRRVIWVGMLCNLFMAGACQLSIHFPYLATWEKQEAYALILGTSSRLMVVSVFTYFVGELLNAYVVATLKARMQGRFFWVRALLGNWLGEGVETALFIPLAFGGSMPQAELLRFGLFYYAFKVSYAFVAMPAASWVAGWLKRVEGRDLTEHLQLEETQDFVLASDTRPTI